MAKITKVCKNCGKEFEVYPYRKDTAKYCSRECVLSGMSGESHPNWKGGLVTLICEECGKKYKVKSFRKDESKFCSQECFGAYLSQDEDTLNRLRKDRYDMTGTTHSEESINKIRESQFGTNNSFYGKSHSDKQKEEWSKNRMGDKSVNWQGGKTTINQRLKNTAKYKDFRKSIFERDNYSCKICGENGDIEMHHRIALSQLIYKLIENNKDKDSTELLKVALNTSSFWDEKNVVTLCRECHKTTYNYYGKGCNRHRRTNKEIKEIENSVLAISNGA